MPQRVRIADGLKTQSAEQLVTMAGAVITGLTNNPAFPAPTVDLKAVQAAADDLNAALAAQAHGRTAAQRKSLSATRCAFYRTLILAVGRRMNGLVNRTEYHYSITS